MSCKYSINVKRETRRVLGSLVLVLAALVATLVEDAAQDFISTAHRSINKEPTSFGSSGHCRRKAEN